MMPKDTVCSGQLQHVGRSWHVQCQARPAGWVCCQVPTPVGDSTAWCWCHNLRFPDTLHIASCSARHAKHVPPHLAVPQAATCYQLAVVEPHALTPPTSTIQP